VTTPAPVAVLTSGGADSAVLVADQARQGRIVQPIYVRFGLAWERVEEAHLRSFLESLPASLGIRPLLALDFPITDVYGAHWSVSGTDVPDEKTPDSAVYLPGRNLLLLAKSSVWCALHDVEAIALGTLKGNPFSDSGADFFGAFGCLAELALGGSFSVMTPFASLTKTQVLELGRDLELWRTFSCIDPEGDRHCGRCNKCAERRTAFADAGMEDHTAYAHR
jgi:7-cyano-7-deazaguanine synthase